MQRDPGAVGKEEIAFRLEPGTLRSYSEFAQCRSCERPYWRGAHADRLDKIIAGAARLRVAAHPHCPDWLTLPQQGWCPGFPGSPAFSLGCAAGEWISLRWRFLL